MASVRDLSKANEEKLIYENRFFMLMTCYLNIMPTLPHRDKISALVCDNCHNNYFVTNRINVVKLISV